MNDRTDRIFNYIIKGFISLICLHGIASYLQIALPLALLFGPIYFTLYRLSLNKKTRKGVYFHLIPFILMFTFDCLLYFPKQSNDFWEGSFSIYHPLLNFLNMLSVGIYGSYVLFAKRGYSSHPVRLHLVLQMGSVGLVLALFFGILFLSGINVVDKKMIGFDSFLIVWGLLLVLICLMVSYLIAEADRKVNDTGRLVNTIKNANSAYYTLNDSHDIALKAHAVHLEKIVNERKLYLNSGLSLDDVSNETGIPKHNLSQIFNVFIGKGFYQYLAEKRIQEAICRIDDGDNLTLESLAYECGFNSKTSFNKYFKLTTGKTPSEYRSLSESQASQ